MFRKTREKELKMICEVRRGDKRSYLVGTAHFFPYSFRTSLSRYIERADAVLFEGPLDNENMAKVLSAGTHMENGAHLFDELDGRAVERISEALVPTCRKRSSFIFFNLRTLRQENPVYEMLKGMKPWMAFFTIWTTFLERKGWRYSVDAEAFRIAQDMGKEVVFLETIEEQIKVLEGLSREKIHYFLQGIAHWNAYAKDYVRAYLQGDLENLKSTWSRFPTLHSTVIEDRDRILYSRMLDYLERGGAVAFVGAPHLRGIRQMLRGVGYEIQGPGSRSS